ncbi:ABC transporter ATP-binding protein [Lutibaculum baratangense]|uniref:Methionine ABC transporter ATP-binding protein n=1 Tax=Lutibaculum baratangense AMV1 TaxID=631454 RepID=V4RLW8_9HYPH|nr:ABC transporter ATP-binding protein [Lutibaculum baratangense]ESR24240.1 Methionine ABC transporter ATP-binding protein [Lutibaculum baratangense AMV1]
MVVESQRERQPRAAETVIEARGLTVGFGDTLIHQNLDLDVYRGEILGIVGGSGTGKSVLLRTLIGLVKPRAGSIRMFGTEMATAGPAEAAAVQTRWGVLFQQGALFSSLNVQQNVEAPMREHLDLEPELRGELARLKLSMVGLQPDAANKMPSELSGGMIKRVALARAIALDPDLLFLDEPTSGLDPIGAADFDNLIAKLQETLGLTVFMVTHDLDSLFSICSRVAAIGNKKILVAGDLETVVAYDDPWIKAYFGGQRGRSAQLAHG